MLREQGFYWDFRLTIVDLKHCGSTEKLNRKGAEAQRKCTIDNKWEAR
jgi:hypothetical protein